MQLRLLFKLVVLRDNSRRGNSNNQRFGLRDSSFFSNKHNEKTDMKEINTGKHKLEIYDSIEDMPVARHHKFNKMLLIDSGIGSDLKDINTKIERVMRFMKDKDKQEFAVTELQNLRQCINFIQSELSPKHLAFCALVKSIDGVEYTDISDDGLQTLQKELKKIEITENDLTSQLGEVKKKTEEQLTAYFPDVIEDAEIKEYYDRQKERTLLRLKEIIEGKEQKEKIEELTNLLVTFIKPIKFEGKDNAEIKYDKEFENGCLLISQQLNRNAKEMSVLEYYQAFEYIKKMNKRSK